MKIILAVGHPQVEASIEKQLPPQCEVVGVATYREAVLTKLREFPNTNVVLIRDNLPGDLKILSLIHQIRAEFNDCRIILMTKHREAGDPFLAGVVSYAIWDIILGYKVSVSTLVDYILRPRTFKDVERFQKRLLVDENSPAVESTVDSSTSMVSESVSSSSSAVTNTGVPFPSTTEAISSSPFPSATEPASSSPFPSASVETTSIIEPMVTSSQPSSPVSMNGSMRAQLFKQMEASDSVSSISTGTADGTLFGFNSGEPVPIAEESSFVFNPAPSGAPASPFSFDSTPVTPTSSNDSSFTFDPNPVESIPMTPTPDIPIVSDFKFPSEPEPTISEPSVPKFGFKASAEEGSDDMAPVREPKKAKLFSTKDVDSIDKPLVGHRPAFNNQIKNSPIVMSLIGFKGGVGTSQTAFNLAVTLAKSKNRVLYVELNDHGLPLTYLYNLSSLRGGLEDALRAAQSAKVQDFSNYVTRFKVLKETHREKEMQSLLKPYPDTLDFLTFSHFFVFGEKEEYYPEQLKGLLSDLLLSEGYQYIILDVNVNSNPVLVSQALRSSKYICPVITQDMVSVGQTVELLKTIHQHQFPLHQKLQFILNRYDATCYSDKSILRWITHELPLKPLGIWTIPEASAAYNKANDKSKPVVLTTAPKPVAQAFETLHNYLKTM